MLQESLLLLIDQESSPTSRGRVRYLRRSSGKKHTSTWQGQKTKKKKSNPSYEIQSEELLTPTRSEDRRVLISSVEPSCCCKAMRDQPQFATAVPMKSHYRPTSLQTLHRCRFLVAMPCHAMSMILVLEHKLVKIKVVNVSRHAPCLNIWILYGTILYYRIHTG